MIEFRSEPAYLTLLTALTTTRHLTLLSLAGTAPAPTPCLSPHSGGSTCSPALLAALQTLLADSPSLQYLDLSGFSGKLDDGQLPAGFGRALAGLAHNATLTHLRIRNQNLHDEAGTLGRVLARNATLRVVDCRDNNFNLTSLGFLVDSLERNTGVVEFPLPGEEREAIWKNVLKGLHRSVGGNNGGGAAAAAARGGAAAAAGKKDLLKGAEEGLLRGVLEGLVRRLEDRLRVNRERAGLTEKGGDGGWGKRHRHVRSGSSGVGLGVFVGEEGGWPGFDVGAVVGVGNGNGNGNANGPSRSLSMDSEPPTGDGGSKALQSSTMHEAESPHPVPYLGSGGGVVAGMESPNETLDSVSGVADGEAEGRWLGGEEAGEDADDLFRKMVNDFQRAGFV
jgi:hypothetical protein